MHYVLHCLRCGVAITATEHVGNADVAAIEEHLRAAHPGVLPTSGRMDFAQVLSQVRVKMA